MAMRWWVRRGTETIGPFEAEYVRAGVRNGTFAQSDHVCAEGHQQWSLLGHVAELVGSPPTSGVVVAPAGDQAPALNAVGEYERRIAELRAELEAVEDALEIQSFGFYRPRYGFSSSSEYEARLSTTRDHQKNMIRNGRATGVGREWAVDGSVAKGRQAVKEHSKLMLRAFNGECDAAIGKVRYDNVLKLEKRVRKSHADINVLGRAKMIWITEPYRDLKLEELYLVHEHREKVHEEREEQRRIKEQMREEERARKEIEKAQSDAEKEEERRQEALEKARGELSEATAGQHDRLEALVNKLEAELGEAIDRKARAIARAQLTRSGHVYVLSNIGSFGQSIFKIGMTRRFEPLDRVHELGDASVPFRFDVHAMIYCEDAPALEAGLHRHFHDRRVNKVNHRREYFRVTLEEIRQAVAKHHGIVTFVTVPEAKEYRKTRALEDESRPAQVEAG